MGEMHYYYLFKCILAVELEFISLHKYSEMLQFNISDT